MLESRPTKLVQNGLLAQMQRMMVMMGGFASSFNPTANPENLPRQPRHIFGHNKIVNSPSKQTYIGSRNDAKKVLIMKAILCAVRQITLQKSAHEARPTF